MGDSANDIDRTYLDTDRRLRRRKFILVGASVQMAWKWSGFESPRLHASQIRESGKFWPLQLAKLV